MFSCLLFEGSQLLEPKNCDVSVDVTGWIGEGRADVRFHSNTQRSLTNTVLYIPTLLCHGETRSKTQLSLVSCSLKWLSSEVLLKQDDLTLTKSQWLHQESAAMQRCKLAHHKVKSKLEPQVFTIAGALSPNDLIFFIGDIDSGVELHVNVSYIFHIQPQISDTTVSCTVATMLTQCDRIHLQANITGMGEITSIDHLDGAHSSSCRISSYKTSTLTTCTVTSNTKLSTPLGILITLCDPPLLKSNCFSVLFDTPITVPQDNGHTTNTIHGVQMLSTLPCTQTKAQSWKELAPCEALFMVDCSGSMCGKKIHSASQALILAVKSLPEATKFNIIAFGSKYRFLFQTSTEASAKNIDKAIQFANQLQACLGGTELLTPLRWLLKKPLIDGLQRELFLITDGGVPNVNDVINTVRRYKHQTRCHSFALGPDISSELMAGIAVVTRGSYIVINEDTRLQTMVMEVVKKVIQPKVTDVSVSWPAPGGYTTSKPFPPLQSDWSASSPQIHFTTLTKHPHALKNGTTTMSITPPTITGFLSSERVQSTAILNHENAFISAVSSQSKTMLRNAAWVKMQCLYNELSESGKRTRNNAHNNTDEPPLKKRKVTTSDQDYDNKDELVNNIVSISLASGVSFYPYTHLTSSRVDPTSHEEEGNIPCSILPWNGPVSTRAHASSRHQPRKRKHQRRRHSTQSSSTTQSTSTTLSSIATRSVSSIYSTLKTVVNIASFGLVTMETSDPILEGGERIEDQVYHQNKHDRIHWNQYNKLVLPKIYYKSYSANQDTSGSDVAQSTGGSDAAPQTGSGAVQTWSNITRTHSSSSDSDHNNDVASSQETQYIEVEPMDNNGHDEMAQLNSFSQPDYMALIQLQLPSGGWPHLPSLYRATGSTMGYIRSLPCNQDSLTSVGGSEEGEGPGGNVWATLLAVGCLRHHFYQFKVEWEVLVMKAVDWVDSHQHSIPISLGEAEGMVKSHFSNQ